MRAIVELSNRLAALERRVSGAMRHGTVAEVNTADGWVRLDLGPGTDGPLLSPRIPYAQIAGALAVHAPPSVGQQMTFIAPGGDMRQALALPMSWGGGNASPASGADPALTFGDVRIDLTGGALTITVAGVTVSLSGAGLSITGGRVDHDGSDIGATHTHGGIVPGPANTNPPNP